MLKLATIIGAVLFMSSAKANSIDFFENLVVTAPINAGIEQIEKNAEAALMKIRAGNHTLHRDLMENFTNRIYEEKQKAATKCAQSNQNVDAVEAAAACDSLENLDSHLNSLPTYISNCMKNVAIRISSYDGRIKSSRNYGIDRLRSLILNTHRCISSIRVDEWASYEAGEVLNCFPYNNVIDKAETIADTLQKLRSTVKNWEEWITDQTKRYTNCISRLVNVN